MLKLSVRNPEAALDLSRRARALSPGYGEAYLVEAQVLLLLGQASEALAMIDRGLEYTGSLRGSDHLGWLVAGLVADGLVGEAEQVLAEIRETGDFFALGLAHTALGNLPAAIEAFRNTEWNDVRSLILRGHPYLDPLRTLSEFEELIAEVDRWWGLAGTP